MAMNSSVSPDNGHGSRVMSSPFIVGAISGALSTVMFQPFDLVKTRMQMQSIFGHSNTHLPKANTADVFLRVIRQESVLALWKGVSPSLQRCVPGIGMYFGCIETFKKAIPATSDGHITPFKALLISSSARAIAAFTFLPFTVVKARYESGLYSYRSVYHALSSIWVIEGPSGLYRGLTVTLARDLPFSSIFYILYSQSTQYLQSRSSQTQLDMASILGCGFVSGLVASVITQPCDVIKTRVQVNSGPNQGIMTVLKSVTSNGTAIRGLYSGLTPRVMRRTMMAAFTWLFYEEINQLVSKYS